MMARRQGRAVRTKVCKTRAMVDFAHVDALAAGYHRRAGQPGLAYGIVAGGELVHAAGLGERHIGGPRPDAGTVFRIASMTKSFTAAAILTLRDDGVVRLEDPAEDYVPELRDWPRSAGRRHGLPHRLDDQELYRRRDPDPARRRRGEARGPSRGLRARAARLAAGEPGRGADLDQAPADDDRGLPDRRPVGRPPAGPSAPGLRALPQQGRELQLRAGHPVRVFQPRLRDPGPGHYGRHGHGLPGLRPAPAAEAAGHDAHRL